MSTIDIDPLDLVGVKELAEGLADLGYSVERTHISTWISRRTGYVDTNGITKDKGNGFPLPLADLAMGGVYLFTEVLEWVELHYPDGARKPARPIDQTPETEVLEWPDTPEADEVRERVTKAIENPNLVPRRPRRSRPAAAREQATEAIMRHAPLADD